MADPEETEENKDINRIYPRSRKVPAIFVDNFLVTGNSTIIRIAFAESADEPPGSQYRVAVALPLADAKELGRIVLKMIAEIESEATEEA